MKVQIATVKPVSTQQLYSRLTETEKIDLRRASPARLEYLATTSYRVEAGAVKVMEELQRMCIQVVKDYDAQTDAGTGPEFIPSLWRY